MVLTTLGWIWCLQELPLSRAYLFMALAYIFVPGLSWLAFGETPGWQYFLGTVLYHVWHRHRSVRSLRKFQGFLYFLNELLATIS